MDIQRAELPAHPVAGEQWALIHHVPTHDMALAVSEAVMEFSGTARALRLQTVVVGQLVEDWRVFAFDGTAVPFAAGTGVGQAPQATVQRVFKLCEPIAQRIVDPDDGEAPAPNRAARREAR